jgi:hypothetical protein
MTAVDAAPPAAHESLPTGIPVEVRNRFDASWSSGFEIAAMTPGGYWLRRRSDQYVLPAAFAAGELRRV